MAISIDKLNTSSSPKSHNLHHLTQISLRILSIATTLSSAIIMLANKQSAVVYGIHVDASYSYSPAFKFFIGANIAVSAMSILSLIIVLIMKKKAVNSIHYFFLFVHDLMMTNLLMAGLACAMAISYVGKYGNVHTGWVAICDNFGKFCNKGIASITLGFLGLMVNLILTIISAFMSRGIKS